MPMRRHVHRCPLCHPERFAPLQAPETTHLRLAGSFYSRVLLDGAPIDHWISYKLGPDGWVHYTSKRIDLRYVGARIIYEIHGAHLCPCGSNRWCQDLRRGHVTLARYHYDPRTGRSRPLDKGVLP